MGVGGGSVAVGRGITVLSFKVRMSRISEDPSEKISLRFLGIRY